MAVSCAVTIILVECNFQEENWSFLLPLILLGVAYSIYAGALWSSIPYVVPAPQLGTAFGLCTSVQNAGLSCVPYLIGTVLTTKPEDPTDPTALPGATNAD